MGISDCAAAIEAARNARLVIIGGCSRSGKSTLAASIAAKIPATVLLLDDFLIGIEDRKPWMTVRDRYRYDDIRAAVEGLLQGSVVLIDRYDPQSRSLTGERQEVSLRGVLIVEGVVALDVPFLREHADVSIYVDMPDDERKRRVIKFYKSKGLSEQAARKVFEEREAEEVPFIKRTERYANIICTNFL
ncbi:hypothetical protein JXA12_01910 [Candidatus Woesearchaeota archaeon]|nr:hypothetical protein [Candidatus Woesearchaeota archaeon]